MHLDECNNLVYVASRENGQVLSFSIDKLQVSRAGGVYNRGQRPCCSLSLTPLSRLDSPIGQGHCRPSLRWPRLVVAHQAKWRYLGPDLGQRRQGAPCCLLHPYGICTFFIGRETLLPTPLSPQPAKLIDVLSPDEFWQLPDDLNNQASSDSCVSQEHAHKVSTLLIIQPNPAPCEAPQD